MPILVSDWVPRLQPEQQICRLFRSSLDFGINDNISLGGYVGYSSSKEDFSGFGANYSWKYTYIIVGARGAYHFDLVDNMDTYAGLMLGYNVASTTYDGPGATPASPSVGGIAYSGFLGARYHFGDTFGVMLNLDMVLPC